MSNYGKPTPGPWKIINDRGLQIVSSDLKTVIARVAAHKKDERRCHSTTNTDHFTREANARLIAAAPDLLAALESVMADIREYLNWDGDGVEGADDPAAFFIKEYKNAERIIQKIK